MRSSGVWLVDASVSALYRAGERLAQGRTYDAVLRACWDAYVGPAIISCAPSAVVLIGKQVHAAIGEALRHDLGNSVRVEVIKQPNAHMSVSELTAYRQQIFEFCRGLKAGGKWHAVNRK
jgi:hypothetical protein